MGIVLVCGDKVKPQGGVGVPVRGVVGQRHSFELALSDNHAMSLVGSEGLPFRLVDFNPHLVAEDFEVGDEQSVVQVESHFEDLVLLGPVEDPNDQVRSLVRHVVVLNREVDWQFERHIVLVENLNLKVVVVKH